MTATAAALLAARPRAATAATAAVAAVAAAWAARGLGPLGAATAAFAAAAYTAAAVIAWHRSQQRKRLGEARREAADAVAYLAADLTAGTDPNQAVTAIEPDWPAGAASTARRLAVAWSVAAELGAPAAELCRRLAEHLREDAQSASRTKAQTSSIRATAVLLTVLPVGGVVLGESLGADSVRFLLATAPGIACLAAAMTLQAAGIAWTVALVASVGTEQA